MNNNTTKKKMYYNNKQDYPAHIPFLSRKIILAILSAQIS